MSGSQQLSKYLGLGEENEYKRRRGFALQSQSSFHIHHHHHHHYQSPPDLHNTTEQNPLPTTNMATIATLLERNKSVTRPSIPLSAKRRANRGTRAAAAKHTPLPYLSEMSKVGAPPLRTLIGQPHPLLPVGVVGYHALTIVSAVTCVDPRCIPENYFDIKAGGA